MRYLLFVLFVLVFPVHAEWVQVDSPHFTVISEVGARRGREIARYFEQARVVFEARYPKFKIDGGEQQVIFALKNKNSFKLFMPDVYEKYGDISSMHYGGWMRRNTLVRGDIQERAYRDALWGFTGTILSLNFAHMPAWMSSGLSQYFSTIEVSKDQVNVGMPIDNVRVLTSESWLPLEDIANAQSDLDFPTRSRKTIYHAESWLMVHYCLLSKEGRKSTYLEDLVALDAKGVSPVDALNQVFGSVKELQRKLRIYAKSGKYAYYTEKNQLKVAYESYPVTTLTENQVLGYRSALWASTKAGTVNEQDLSKLQAAVTEPGVASNLGLTLYHLGKKAEAMERFSQIPQDQLTWLDAYLLNESTTLTEEAKRGFLEKSLALNPQSAMAASKLARSLHSVDPNRAIELLNLAVTNEPGRLDYRIFLGWILIQTNNYPKALEAARFARAMAKTPEEIQLVETQLIAPLQEALKRNMQKTTSANADEKLALTKEERAGLKEALESRLSSYNDYEDYTRLAFTGTVFSSQVIDPEGFKVDKTELSGKCKKATQAVLDGELAQAETLLNEILAENGDYEPALDLMVHLMCVLRKSDEAETALLHYAEISQQPKNVGERYFQLAEVLTQQKLTGPIGQKIETYLKKADSLTEGGIPLTNFYLGQLYMAFGLEEQALPPFEKYLQSKDTSNWRFQAEESVKYLKQKLKK